MLHSGRAQERATPPDEMGVLLFVAEALARQHPEYDDKRVTTQHFRSKSGERLRLSRLNHPEYGDHLIVETPTRPGQTIHLRVTGGEEWQRTEPTRLTATEIHGLTDQLVTATLAPIVDGQQHTREPTEVPASS